MVKKKQKAKKNKSNGWIAWILLAVVIIGALILFTSSGGETMNKEALDTFAKCLSSEGAVMYGAFWCPHCARTKKKFADSFEHIKYIECDPRGPEEQSELCIQKDIQAYDTWEFSDGSRLIGEPSFEALSKKTGCAQP